MRPRWRAALGAGAALSVCAALSAGPTLSAGPVPSAVTPVDAAGAVDGWTALYEVLLRRHVKPGERFGVRGTYVDYRALSRDKVLPAARARLAALPSVDHLPQPARLAFWINAYNFLTLDLVAASPGVASIRDLGRDGKTPWMLPRGRIAGRAVTLDDIEHVILRPLGEPRIHAALVCAAVSCPDLRTEAYRGDRLDAQLADALRSFITNPRKGLATDTAARTLRFSAVFQWFKDDFGGDAPAWLRRRGFLPAGEWRTAWLDYDWRLNALR